MADEFTYDVFHSHSSKDKAIARNGGAAVGGRRAVWLDDWEIRPGDSIPAKVEEGPEHSRVLVFCVSANTFGSDWAQLETGTCRSSNLPFRNPTTKKAASFRCGWRTQYGWPESRTARNAHGFRVDQGEEP